jgi:hypothetical protein
MMPSLEHSHSSDKTALTARILGYGGALPFLGGAIMASQDMGIPGFATSNVLLTYGAIILSFLGGLHWGRVITSTIQIGNAGPVWLFWSVCPPLLGWAALLLPVKAAAILLSVCFMVALGVDQKLIRGREWPAWMRQLRLHLSLIASASLVSLIL